MKRLFLISVLATVALVDGNSAGIPVSRDVLASPMQAPTPCPTTPAAPTLTDDQCLAVSEDVHRAEIVDGTTPYIGCNQHTMNAYGATCTHDFPDRLYMIANTTAYCPTGGVCGEYYYGIFQNSAAMNNTGIRRPVEIGSLRPVLSTGFQTWGITVGPGSAGANAFGFACFLLAATDESGAFISPTEKRFVEYCFTQWKTGGGFPAEFTSWQIPAGSLLSGQFPAYDGDESGVSSVTGVCANATSTATVDTVHVTYGSGPNQVVTNMNMASLAYKDFKIDSRYVNRVL